MALSKINLHEAANLRVARDRQVGRTTDCGAPDLMHGGAPELEQLHDPERQETLLYVLHHDCSYEDDGRGGVYLDWNSDDYLASDVTILKMDGSMSVIPRAEANVTGIPGWDSSLLPWRPLSRSKPEVYLGAQVVSSNSSRQS